MNLFVTVTGQTHAITPSMRAQMARSFEVPESAIDEAQELARLFARDPYTRRRWQQVAVRGDLDAGAIMERIKSEQSARG